METQLSVTEQAAFERLTKGGVNYREALVLAQMLTDVQIGAGFSPLVRGVNTVAVSGAAQTIPDPSAGKSINRVTLSVSCAFTFPAAAAGKSFILELTQGTGGSFTATWPTVRWAGGTAPTLSTAAGKIDALEFWCTDGTHWNGRVLGLDLH